MKFNSKNEMEEISFEGSRITELKMSEDTVKFSFDGAVIKAGNSQNARLEDMYCGPIKLHLQGASVNRIVKEGMKYYDADGKLIREIPDEEIMAPAQAGVWKRCAKGEIFTVVTVPTEEGYGYEFGIDVPQLEDEEETDTFWLCFTCKKTIAKWEKYRTTVKE